MPKQFRVVVAPNAFKGSLDATRAADAMKKGILAALPESDVVCVPVADGGDGLTEVMVAGLGGRLVRRTVAGPRMDPVEAAFCMVAARKLAVVEMARASGLALLPPARHNPTRTTTYGTGELIRDRNGSRAGLSLPGSIRFAGRPGGRFSEPY